MVLHLVDNNQSKEQYGDFHLSSVEKDDDMDRHYLNMNLKEKLNMWEMCVFAFLDER